MPLSDRGSPTVKPWSQVQRNRVVRDLGAADVAGATLTIQPSGGSAIACAAIVDNSTNDSTYVEALYWPQLRSPRGARRGDPFGGGHAAIESAVSLGGPEATTRSEDGSAERDRHPAPARRRGLVSARPSAGCARSGTSRR